MLRAVALSSMILLAGCGPKHVVLADGQCANVAVGDTVEGVATLHSYAGLSCIECGAYLTQKDCPGMLGFRTATDEVDRRYDVITTRRKGDDPDGEIQRRVFVAGPVIPNGATGKPLLNADRLSLSQ